MANTYREEESHSNIHQQPFSGGSSNATVEDSADALGTKVKKRRSLPGNPDPDAEVVALSPRTLLATNRYKCEVCHKGFQRDQNLQLHRRGHNLPWKLKPKATTEAKKRVYVCPEVSCTHHDPSRALGDLTGIKKHFSRKHGEKKWKCDRCAKKYAVQSDWKAHLKICGTKEYRCDCGTVFARKDSFVTHRAYCDALAEQNYRVKHGLTSMVGSTHSQAQEMFFSLMPNSNSGSNGDSMTKSPVSNQNMNHTLKSPSLNSFMPSSSNAVFNPNPSSRVSTFHLGGINISDYGSVNRSSSVQMETSPAYMSATALLQKASMMGAKVSDYGYSTSTRSTLPDTLDNDSETSARGIAGDNQEVLRPGLMPAAIDDDLHYGNHSAYGMNSKWGHAGLSATAPFSQDGMLNSHMMLQSENRSPGAGGMQRRVHEEVGGGENRMAKDFLRLGPIGHANKGDQSYHERVIGMRYFEGEQEGVHGMHSYHQISQDQTALEKPKWHF